MLAHSKARSGLTKVLAPAHVLLVYLFLPLVVFGNQSSELTVHSRSAHEPSWISLTPPEEGNHPLRKTKAKVVSRSGSDRYRVVDDKDYNERIPASYRRTYEDEDLNNRHDTDEQYEDDINDGNRRRTRTSTSKVISAITVALTRGVALRKNMIAVFGQILRASNNGLNVTQHASLNLIQQALILKQVYLYGSVDHVLPKLSRTSGNDQWKVVMKLLANLVPIYLESACKFWMKQLTRNEINITNLTSDFEEPASFLHGLNVTEVSAKVPWLCDKSADPDQTFSKIRNTLGPVFVNIFQKALIGEIPFVSIMFSGSLMSFPVGKFDPILEEYIDYIWTNTLKHPKAYWPKLKGKIDLKDPYGTVFTICKILIDSKKTQSMTKQALRYILLHLKEIPVTFSDESNSDMLILSKSSKPLEILLSQIHDDLTIPELAPLRDRVIATVQNVNIKEFIRYTDLYAYKTPIDLLIGLLTRIKLYHQTQNGVSDIENLLSILSSRQQIQSFKLTTTNNIDLLMLFDFLKLLPHDSKILTLGQNVQDYLQGNIQILSDLQLFTVMENRSDCYQPINCLTQFLKTTTATKTNEDTSIPSKLITLMKELLDAIKQAVSSSTTCRPTDILGAYHSQIVVEKSECSLILPPTGLSHIVPEYNDSSSQNNEIGPGSIPQTVDPFISPENESPGSSDRNNPVWVVFPEDNKAPPYTTSIEPKNTNGQVISFPSILELLHPINWHTPIRIGELPSIPEVLYLLRSILGPYFVQVILGEDVDNKKYPTAISLVDDVLHHALEVPEVQRQSINVYTIKKYLKAIDFISVTLLMPMVINSKSNIQYPVLHVTFDPTNLRAHMINSSPPDAIVTLPGLITIPIYHPKYLMHSVSPDDPYNTLIPTAEKGEVDPMQNLTTNGSLHDILGQSFDPLSYPTRGTLLASILLKLVVSKEVNSNPALMMQVSMYLKGIKAVALYNAIVRNDEKIIPQLRQTGDKILREADTPSLVTDSATPVNRNES